MKLESERGKFSGVHLALIQFNHFTAPLLPLLRLFFISLLNIPSLTVSSANKSARRGKFQRRERASERVKLLMNSTFEVVCVLFLVSLHFFSPSSLHHRSSDSLSLSPPLRRLHFAFFRACQEGKVFVLNYERRERET
jgi:hypothetical protein